MATPRKSPAQMAKVRPVDPAWQQMVSESGAPITSTLIAYESDNDDPPETAADRVARLMGIAEDGDRAVVKLFKVLDSTGLKLGSCCDYTPEEFEAGGVSAIRERWGTGIFRAYLYATIDQGEGKRPKFVRRGMVTLDVLEDKRAPGGVAAPASDMSRALQSLADNQKAMLEALTTRPEPPDPMIQMQTMLTMMTAMRGAMGLDARPAAEKSGLSGLSELASSMQLIKELGRELNGDKPEPDPLTALLPEVLGLIKAGMAPRAALEQVMPSVSLPASVAGAVDPSQAIGDNPMPQIDTEQELVVQLRGYLAALVGLAIANADPSLGADLIFDNLPDEFLDALQGEAWFAVLKGFAPEVAPHYQWLSRVREEVLVLLADEPVETPEPKPSAANDAEAPTIKSAT